MTRTFRILAMAVAVVFTAAGAVDAAKKKKKKKKAQEEEPAPVAAEEYELMQKGHSAYIIRDYDKAYGYYKEAGEKASKNPEVHYYMGCVLKAKGEHADAIESFRTSYLMATGKDAIWKGPALVQVALVREAAKEWEEAKKAWQDFVDYASGKDLKVDATALAKKRIEAIDKMLEMEEKYAPVRKLIEEKKKEAD
ncbi:MAG: tetratricopeptide repeat protein [Deltaproteobacteria bacterium]|nr:tetratricopeptide repeat protein [Deltaproteobacteria bacterium]